MTEWHTHLEVLLQPLFERVGDLVELVELPQPLHGRVVPSGARVQALNDGADIAKDRGVHQSCTKVVAKEVGRERRKRNGIQD